MILAEITTLDQWMLGSSIVMALGTLGALIVMIIALTKKQAVQVEQPLEVRFASEFVHRKDFDGLVERVSRVEEDLTLKIEKVTTELHETELRLAAGGEQRVSLLHGRINEILEAVSEIRGQLIANRTGKR